MCLEIKIGYLLSIRNPLVIKFLYCNYLKTRTISCIINFFLQVDHITCKEVARFRLCFVGYRLTETILCLCFNDVDNCLFFPMVTNCFIDLDDSVDDSRSLFYRPSDSFCNKKNIRGNRKI